MTPFPNNPESDVMESFFWRPLRDGLGLDSEQWDNVMRVVTLHLVLDRLLTALITHHLRAPGVSADIVWNVMKAVGALNFARRIELAEKSQWLPADVAADVREINRVRNKLLHFDPQRQRLDHVSEIASAEAFEKLTKRGHHAYYALVTLLLPALKGAVQTD